MNRRDPVLARGILVSWGEGKTVTELVHDLESRDAADPDRAWRAARALGERKVDDSRARTALVRATAPPWDAATRAHASEALGILEAKEAVIALAQRLDEKTEPYRLARSYAARALGKLGDARAIDPLLAALEGDEYFGVRAEAAEALGKLLPAADELRKARIGGALEKRRAEEEKRKAAGREEGRGARVVREVEQALARLRAIATEAEEIIGEAAAAAAKGDVGRLARMAERLRALKAEANGIRQGLA